MCSPYRPGHVVCGRPAAAGSLCSAGGFGPHTAGDADNRDAIDGDKLDDAVNSD